MTPTLEPPAVCVDCGAPNDRRPFWRCVACQRRRAAGDYTRPPRVTIVATPADDPPGSEDPSDSPTLAAVRRRTARTYTTKGSHD